MDMDERFGWRYKRHGPPGVYGTKGVASAGNVPGGRNSAATWIDSGGNLWLFGGGTNLDQLNDLWEYAPSGGTWKWVDGSDTPNAIGVYGTQGVAAASNVPGARQGAVAWTDSAGNFWLFGGYGYGSVAGDPTSGFDYLNDLWKYSPSAATWAWLKGSDMTGNGGGTTGTSGVPAPANTPGSSSDAVSWIDPSGNLWLFGGLFESNGVYLNSLWVYTPLAP
jgi:N-acetylneuraminic acid mutarotase